MSARKTSGAHLGRRTKIIATVGPASWEPAVLEELVAAGADVFRLNFSHAGPEQQAKTIAAIRAAAERVGREVAILGDLPGPGSPTCARTSSSTSPTGRSGCGSPTPRTAGSAPRSRSAAPSPPTRG